MKKMNKSYCFHFSMIETVFFCCGLSDFFCKKLRFGFGFFLFAYLQVKLLILLVQLSFSDVRQKFGCSNFHYFLDIAFNQNNMILMSERQTKFQKKLSETTSHLRELNLSSDCGSQEQNHLWIQRKKKQLVVWWKHDCEQTWLNEDPPVCIKTIATKFSFMGSNLQSGNLKQTCFEDNPILQFSFNRIWHILCFKIRI